MRRRGALVMVGLLAMFAAGCGSQVRYRYRLTVVIDTPEGVRTGSSVVEVITKESVGFPGPEAGGIRTSVRGEGVVVDLGRRGLLFTLLDEPKYGGGVAGGLAMTALAPRMPGDGGTAADYIARSRALAGSERSGVLPIAKAPPMVRFRDIRDPGSVERVDPRDLGAAFGPGVALRRITVSITDDPVSDGLIERLPWAARYRGRHLDGSSARLHDLTAAALGAHLSPGSFSTEIADDR